MDLEQVIVELMHKLEHRFYGKYRGFVVDNADPQQLGRLKLTVPSVLGETVTGWAMPCVPYGGDNNQGFLFIPETKAGVWVEFEEGDLEFPIWVGTFWSQPGGEDSEVPKSNDVDGAEQDNIQDPPTRKIIKTKAGHTLQFEDADDAAMILIKSKHNHVIVLDQEGIKIIDGVNNNEMNLDQAGMTIIDANGNEIILSSSGVILKADNIKIGSNAAEALVLGTQLTTEVTNFLIALGTHTHVGNMGAPTSPPTAPMQLQVPISSKHTTE